MSSDRSPGDDRRALMSGADGALPRIRRARPDETDDLTALAIRSKAHWGYAEDFMALARPEMTLSVDEVADDETWALEDGAGRLVGFYRIVPADPAVLEDLWIEPDAIGAGHGRLLWKHAVATARALGVTALELDADPNAVGFYERMGARQVGETPSAIVPGRSLPRMRLDLV
jgi:GNAT superfamily N-acetyltransferase